MTDQAARNEDLIGRYVAAVGRRLPPKDAQDILAELREAVSDRLAAREVELGRQADRRELAAILKSFGSPMLAASRYARRQHLIGPDLYPYFWPVQRIVVGIVAAVAIVGSIVQGVLADDPMRLVGHGFALAWNASLFAFGIVTVIFIALEQTKAGASIEQSWRPEHLPRDTHNAPRSLFESLFSLAWDAIFIAWWVGLLPLPNSLPGEAGESSVTIEFSSVWAVVYAPVLMLALIEAAIHAADVVYPTWSRLRSVAAIAVDMAGLWVVLQLARGGQLFTAAGPTDAAERLLELNNVFAIFSQAVIGGIAIAFGIALVVEVRRLLRSFQIGMRRSEALPRS